MSTTTATNKNLITSVRPEITKIEWGMDHTETINIVHLNTGLKIRIWNGNAGYNVHDTASGPLEEGSILVDKIDHGDGIHTWVFETPKITGTVFEDRSGHMQVHGFVNGNHELLFAYYTDELAFTSAELIGLTVYEARELFTKRDIAYLQS